MVFVEWLYSSINKRCIFDPLDTRLTKPLQSVFFVFAIVSFKVRPFGVTLTGKNVCCNTVKEESVVRNNNCAAVSRRKWNEVEARKN